MDYEALHSRPSRFVGRVVVRGLVKSDDKMMPDVEKNESSIVHGALNVLYVCKHKKIRQLNKDFLHASYFVLCQTDASSTHNQNVITHEATTDVGPHQ